MITFLSFLFANRQYNSQAWEVKGKPYGIFTEYLIKRITQQKKVTLVIEDVIEGKVEIKH